MNLLLILLGQARWKLNSLLWFTSLHNTIVRNYSKFFLFLSLEHNINFWCAHIVSFVARVSWECAKICCL